MIDDHHALAQLLHVRQVVRGEQHRRPVLAVHVQDELADALLRHHVQPNRRLVQKHQVGVVHQRSANIRAHTLTQRERAHRRIQEGVQFQQLAELVQVAPEAVGRDAVDVLQQFQRLDHRQIPPQRGAVAEHRADVRHVSLAFAPRHAPVHAQVATGGHQ